MGVPKAAAHDFVPGHRKNDLIIAFGIYPEGKFPEAALIAIDKAKSVILKENRLDQIFSRRPLKQPVQDICAG